MGCSGGCGGGGATAPPAAPSAAAGPGPVGRLRMARPPGAPRPRADAPRLARRVRDRGRSDQRRGRGRRFQPDDFSGGGDAGSADCGCKTKASAPATARRRSSAPPPDEPPAPPPTPLPTMSADDLRVLDIRCLDRSPAGMAAKTAVSAYPRSAADVHGRARHAAARQERDGRVGRRQGTRRAPSVALAGKRGPLGARSGRVRAGADQRGRAAETVRRRRPPTAGMSVDATTMPSLRGDAMSSVPVSPQTHGADTGRIERAASSGAVASGVAPSAARASMRRFRRACGIDATSSAAATSTRP